MNRLEQLWNWIPPLFRVLAGIALVVLAIVAWTWFAVLVGLVGFALVVAGIVSFVVLWRRQREQLAALSDEQADEQLDAPRESEDESPRKA